MRKKKQLKQTKKARRNSIWYLFPFSLASFKTSFLQKWLTQNAKAVRKGTRFSLKFSDQSFVVFCLGRLRCSFDSPQSSSAFEIKQGHERSWARLASSKCLLPRSFVNSYVWRLKATTSPQCKASGSKQIVERSRSDKAYYNTQDSFVLT